MRLADRFFRELLAAEMDISLCWFSVDQTGSFRATSRPSWVRWLIALVFLAPAATFAFWAVRQGAVALPVAAALAVVCPVLVGAGLVLGFSRDELVIQRQLAFGSVRRSWRLLRFERSIQIALPAGGSVRIRRELDHGDSGCWWYTVTLDGVEGIGFTIARDHAPALALARQLTDFLGWPLEDTTAGSRTERHRGGGTA